MHFKYVILYVESPRDTIDFFCKAFDVTPGMITQEGDFGEVNTGETTLAFSSLKLMEDLGKSPARADAKNPCFEIAFLTDDVAGGLAKALKAGAGLVQDVKQEEWGQTTSYVTDTNGFLIEICSPVTAPA
ncbi:VOC family protein [Pseudovibrio sp. Tun.PSC04-5.I4]|uniref:VOC family protein n=1 Tax=Pseudovibrio sp. Tun.PSC04-5.I4 TaxID=1798213 RepID=UPI00088E6A7F|nr:VOC family protein [Pseudovibrio sp. Tun.PSC04-5.I4]SDR22214.1 Glyoxalase-like domain-containing protein [Pseudovibrio sp. Tun.PSC04-5.I4]